MKTSNLRRALALALAMVLCLSLLPMSVMAADTATFEKVTTAPSDWSGTYLLVYEGDGASGNAFDSTLSKLDAANNNVAVTISNGTITADPALAVIVEAVDGGYTMKTAGGTYIYSTSDANKLVTSTNADTAAQNPLTLSLTDTGVHIVGSSGAVMRYNSNSGNYRFRFFKSGTYSSQKAVTLYKLSEGGSDTPVDVTFADMTPAVSGEWAPGSALTLSVDTSTITDQSSISAISYEYKIDDAAEWIVLDSNVLTLPADGELGKHTVQIQAVMDGVISKTVSGSYTIAKKLTIAEARAAEIGTEGITVEGTVVYISGRNVVIQDATAGINLYCSANATDLALGDVIEASGTRAAYNGLEQLSSATYTKTGSAELPVAETTIADILNDNTAALESTRIELKGVILGAVSGSNTALIQGDASINIYGIPEHEIPVGTVVDVVAVVSDFKGYQLRVASADDITVHTYDVSEYRSGDVYTAPTMAGFVFAGWYTDASYSTPLGKNVTTGTAYAKFVDETVLSIKWQVNGEATSISDTAKLRLLTTVDSLNYSLVGFNVEINGKARDLTSKTVYEQVVADDATYDAPSVFCESSAYFMTVTISNIPNAEFDTTFNVVPMWVTLDGTTVTGVARSFCINDAFPEG